MATNLKEFNKALTESSKRVHGDMEKWYRSVIIEVFRRIVIRTPVDTGRARGNWQLELGKPANGTLDINMDKDSATQFAMNNAVSKLSLIPAFSLVHITNNVEYVYYLEYDRRSPQFPEGMVEITLTEMTGWLSGIGR